MHTGVGRGILNAPMKQDPRERSRPLGASAVLLVAWLVGGCEPAPAPTPTPTGPVALVSVDEWDRVAEPEDDVFGAERPADLVCDETLGIGFELLDDELALEINTDLCNYVTLRQPSLVALVPGDTVTLRLWHYPLVAPMPAEAHLALALDGEIVWEEQLSIPAEADFVDGEFIVERALPAGAELQFHVHNHGNNTYDLLGIEADPTGAR